MNGNGGNGSVIKVNWTLMTSRKAGANGVSARRKASTQPRKKLP